MIKWVVNSTIQNKKASSDTDIMFQFYLPNLDQDNKRFAIFLTT